MRNTEVTVGNLPSSQIFNSSANEISVPIGSTITKAFLFWFGTLEVPDSSDFGVAPVDESKRGTVLLAGPAEDCSGAAIADCEVDGTVSTESLGAGQSGFYVAHADVTQKVAEQFGQDWTVKSGSKSGVYSVGNIQGAQGLGTSAGWSLLVVYANSNQDLQHIEIKSGFALVAPRSAHNFEFTGFDSPLIGDISSSVGFIGVDGDAGTTGDSLTIRAPATTTLAANSVNPNNNVMNSSISLDGVRSAFLSGETLGRSKNTFGAEADQFTLLNAVDHGSNTARITLNTTADIFYISGIAFATPLGKSELSVTKFVSGITHGGAGSATEVTAGDILEYTLAIDNVGVSTATNVSLQDSFDDVYLTNIQTANPACAVIGSDLNCANLGNLTPAQTPIAIVVTAEVKPGSGTFNNFATAQYGGHQGPSTAISNTVTTAYAKFSADLSLKLDFTKVYVQAGKPVTLRARITNFGPGQDNAPELSLTIPSGLTLASDLPEGCTQNGQKITCFSIGLGIGENLSPGDSGQLSLTFSTKTGQSKYRIRGLVKTGNLSGDPNLANNSANALVGINHPPIARKIFISTRADSGSIAKSISSYISDPDSDSLQITVGSAPKTVGSLLLNGSQLVYTPSKTFVGTFTVRYFLNDGRGGQANSEITVQVISKTETAPQKCRGFVRIGC